jgi:hypothetical protein
MLDLDFQIIEIILSKLSPTWIDRWDDFLEEYFMTGMFPEDCRPIKDIDMMLIKEYVSEGIFHKKYHKRRQYLYLLDGRILPCE